MRGSNRTLLAAALVLAAAPTALAAGDVSVVVDGGVASIVGDAARNVLTVTSAGAADSFTIVGEDGTTVNGGASLTVSDVRKLTFALGDGADDLLLEDFTLRRHLKIDLGDGADDLALRNVAVKGRTRIRTGEGDDFVSSAGNCHFRGPFRIRTGFGDDTVRLRSSTFRSRLRAALRDGDDAFTLDRVRTIGFGRVFVATGDGDDDVIIDQSDFDQDVGISTGEDDDYVLIDDSDLDEDLVVDLGRDHDDIVLRDSDFDEDVKLDGGRGHDHLVIRDGVSFRRKRDGVTIRFRGF